MLESVEPTPPLPLPKGPDPEAWVVDVTPTKWVRRTWATSECPYTYTPAGQLVRLSMPAKGYMRYEPLLNRLTGLVERLRLSGDLPERFQGDNEWNDAMRAMLILATATMQQGTPFVVYRIEPQGRVWFFHRLRRWASWHPDAPRVGT